MTQEQIAHVRETFEMVRPIADVAAGLFYTRLFELDPNLAPLFTSTDMKEQGRKLMGMLAMVVAGIDRFDTLRPAVQDLGRRHVGYRVQPADYATVGAALLWTLEQGLGDDYTEDVAHAWTAAYTVLSGEMIAGGHGVVVEQVEDADLRP